MYNNILYISKQRYPDIPNNNIFYPQYPIFTVFQNLLSDIFHVYL